MLSKTFEKTVSYQIFNHLVSNEIIDPYQSGFREGYSTESCLVKLADDIRDAKSKKLITALILFDFTKAFDRINFKILLGKLKKYGFDGHSLRWFESYLVGRKQSVMAGRTDHSDWGTVENGVPQGSVLGPLLFLIYINDIGSALSPTCRRLLFADDLQIYYSFPLDRLDDMIACIESDINSIAEWCLANSLTLNSAKTQAIIFGHHTYLNSISSTLTSFPCCLGEVPIVDTVKNLGILMDSKLSWEPQVTSTINKINSVLFRLRRFAKFTDESLRAKLISTLVLPHFDYCAAVLGELSGTLDTRLQVALNSCVRYVFNLGWREHVTPYRIKLHWLSARNRRLYLSACLLHKTLLISRPSYLKERLTWMVTSRPQRREGPFLHINFSSSQQLLNSFSYHTSNFWNSLPPQIRQSETIDIFKFKLKTHLLSIESLETTHFLPCN